MSEIFIKTITPITSVVNTNIIICKHNVTDEELNDLSRDLENDVKNSPNEIILQMNMAYAVETDTGWHRAIVKFVRKKDKIPVLQLIDWRKQPMNFCSEMKVRKIISAQLRDKEPAYFKLMIYGLGTYTFDDEYYLIFDQLFKSQKITGLFTLLETKSNIVNECFVGDLFYKIGQKVRSFRELLIHENISYPSRVRTDINQRIFFARTNFLSRGQMSLIAPSPSAPGPTAPSPSGYDTQEEYGTPIAVIGERVNIYEVLGEGTVCNSSRSRFFRNIIEIFILYLFQSKVRYSDEGDRYLHRNCCCSEIVQRISSR